MYQVIPVGVFQPSGDARWHERRDFSLWRCMLREFDEELRGGSEDYGHGPVDYDSWPFARRMTAALEAGQIHVWCLGLGVDPLTYATDLLTVAVIDSRVFDELFSLAPRGNAEGSVLAAREFAAHVIDRVVTGEPVQAAGAALLRLAWRHRDTLTGLPQAVVARALQLEQAERGELVGDQDVEEAAAQRAQDGLDLVQASGHADHLGDLRRTLAIDVIRHHQRLGQPERPAQLPAHLERVQVVRVQVDRDQADLARPVQHPADRGPGHRQPLGDLVLGQLVLVVEPGHPQEQFLAA